MRRLTILLCAVAGAACSTPYQEMGFFGGVAAQQVSNDTYRILSRGNAYTSATSIQDYTLLKAAETAQRAGATHFQIVGAKDASRVHQTTGSIRENYAGGLTYDPPERYVSPGEDTYIRVLTLQQGQRPPPGVFSAAEIIQYVGARVKRPNT